MNNNRIAARERAPVRHQRSREMERNTMNKRTVCASLPAGLVMVTGAGFAHAQTTSDWPLANASGHLPRPSSLCFQWPIGVSGHSSNADSQYVYNQL